MDALIQVNEGTHSQKKQTNKQANKQRNKQINKHTDKQTNNQSNKQTIKQTNKQTNKQRNKQKTRSIQRTQTPPRLSPLTCDVDLMTRSRTLKLSKIMLRFDKFCNHSF